MFSASQNCRYNFIYATFVVAAGILHPKSCVLFPIFFSFFKLDFVGLIEFPDLNVRLAKMKPLTTVCISNFSRFCYQSSSFLCYQVQKLRNFVFSFIFNKLTAKVQMF